MLCQTRKRSAAQARKHGENRKKTPRLRNTKDGSEQTSTRTVHGKTCAALPENDTEPSNWLSILTITHCFMYRMIGQERRWLHFQLKCKRGVSL